MMSFTKRAKGISIRIFPLPVKAACGGSLMPTNFPPWTMTFVPAMSSFVLVTISTFATAVIEDNASPLNPIVITFSRSSIFCILLVECFMKERDASSLLIPHPLSITRISFFPLFVISILISDAPASMEFSIIRRGCGFFPWFYIKCCYNYSFFRHHANAVLEGHGEVPSIFRKI